MSTRTLQNIRSLYILTLFIILICNGSFNLYKSSHPLRKTTSLFDRLKYHEIITFNHNQFHQIDTGSHPIYPTNGKLEFFAFNRHYKLLIRKNLELFSDSFHTATHRFNHTTQEWEKEIHSTEIPQCYYTAELIPIYHFHSHFLFFSFSSNTYKKQNNTQNRKILKTIYNQQSDI